MYFTYYLYFLLPNRSKSAAALFLKCTIPQLKCSTAKHRSRGAPLPWKPFKEALIQSIFLFHRRATAESPVRRPRRTQVASANSEVPCLVSKILTPRLTSKELLHCSSGNSHDGRRQRVFLSCVGRSAGAVRDLIFTERRQAPHAHEFWNLNPGKGGLGLGL